MNITSTISLAELVSVKSPITGLYTLKNFRLQFAEPVLQLLEYIECNGITQQQLADALRSMSTRTLILQLLETGLIAPQNLRLAARNLFFRTDTVTEQRFINASTVVFGCPYDFASKSGRTCSRGPEYLRSLSGIATWAYDQGDIRLQGSLSEREIGECIHYNTWRILTAQKFLVMLGGDHSMTYPAVLGASRFFSKMKVLHFDAHSDLGDSFNRNKKVRAATVKHMRNHANFMSSIGVIPEVSAVIQVGLRCGELTLSSSPGLINKVSQYSSAYCRGADLSHLFNNIKRGEECVYVTIDLDFFDPSEGLPVTTPYHDGVKKADGIRLINDCFSALERRIVAVDIMETTKPGPEHTDDQSIINSVFENIKKLGANSETVQYGS